MNKGFFQLVKKAFGIEQRLTPLDNKIARHWTKQRLLVVFPELRNNPAALDRAYHSLSLTARDGAEEGETGTIFEVSAPGLDS